MDNYRLTIMPALDVTSRSIEFKFETLAEAMAAHESASLLLLFMQDDIKVMNDYSNVFEVEHFIDGEWIDIDSM